MERKVERSPSSSGPRKPGLVRRRVTYGLILGAVALSLIGWDFATGRSFGIAVLTAAALGLSVSEVLRMLSVGGPPVSRGPAVLAAISMVALQVAGHEAPGAVSLPPDVDLLLVLGFLMLCWSSGLRGTPSPEKLRSLLVTTFGVVYVLGLGAFTMRVRYLGEELGGAATSGANLGTWLVLFAIVAAKGSDIFAFFTGYALGKRKLIPKVSPGKTIAGGVGALLGAILITLGLSALTGLGDVFPWWAAVPLGILLGVTAMVGDLVESLIKRSTATKDSGGLVPEFGGALDIIDSILFVLPVVYVAAWAFAG
ncbi:phosphatidate cytidylyltransferase [Planctomycetota bacterium]